MAKRLTKTEITEQLQRCIDAVANRKCKDVVSSEYDRRALYKAHKTGTLDAYKLHWVARRLTPDLIDRRTLVLKDSVLKAGLEAGLLQLVVVCPKNQIGTDQQRYYERPEFRVAGCLSGAITPVSAQYQADHPYAPYLYHPEANA